MWDQYRKTVVPMQLIIMTVCLIFVFIVQAPTLSVFILFLIMQGFAVLGAAWGKRLRGKIDRSRGDKNWRL